MKSKAFTALKIWLVDNFKKYPQITFNALFFGGITLLLVVIYISLYKGNASNETYIKRKINALKDQDRLDTLLKLIDGDQIRFRDFPYINTYTVSIKANKKENLDSYTYIATYVSTANFSFVGISSNKFLYKNAQGEWELDSLDNGKLNYRSFQDGVQYNTTQLVAPLSNSKNDLKYLVIDGFKFRTIKVELPDSLKNKTFRELSHSPTAGRLYILGANTEFDVEDLEYDEGPISSTNRPELNSKLNLYSVQINSDFPKLVWHLKIGNSFFSPFVNRLNLYYISPNTGKDSLLKKGGYSVLVFQNKLLPSLVALPGQHQYKNSINDYMSIGNEAYFITTQKDSVTLRSLSGYRKSVAPITYSFKPGKSTESIQSLTKDIYGNNVWFFLGYGLQDSTEVGKLTIANGDKPTYSDKQIFTTFSKRSISKDRVTFFSTNEDKKTFVSTDGKNVFYPSSSDTGFLLKVKRALLYVPQYDLDANEYVADYGNGLALVRIIKNNNKYEYHFIGNIAWPKDFLSVDQSIDVFYIIILIAFCGTAYVIFYFICRSYFNSERRIVDYSSQSVFMHLPLLKTKVQMIESDMNQLKLRSDYMLALGMFFGVGGVLASIVTFQITEATIGNSWTNPHTFLGIFRPVILLVFIETFTFYFLKQYRIIFNEYKRFYSAFLNMCGYFNIIELQKVNDGDISGDTKKTILDKLRDENMALHENNTLKQVDEFDHDSMLKLIEAMDKFKK